MSEQHPEDLPWNDSPADDDAQPGSMEPDPAEVVGDDESARDLSAPHVPGERESLEERLSEEEPERPLRGDQSDESPELMDAADADDDIAAGEPDETDPVEARESATEDAAVRVVDEDQV